VWRGGGDAEEPTRHAALAAELAPRVDPASDANKQRLRDATDQALARGVFGVPTLGIGDKLFWGFDALDMAAALLRKDPWFDEPHWQREGAPRAGVRRA
jgi:2-hydroxychromene-2-carboxylate isomerase